MIRANSKVNIPTRHSRSTPMSQAIGDSITSIDNGNVQRQMSRAQNARINSNTSAGVTESILGSNNLSNSPNIDLRKPAVRKTSAKEFANG